MFSKVEADRPDIPRRKFPVWEAPAVLLAFLLMAGVVHATPIVSLSDQDFPSPAQLTSPTNPKPAAKTAEGSSTTAASGSGYEAASEPAVDSCTFTSSCYTTMKVPEPQSLVLVGSGLLSMAAMVRRRLIRK